jgi:hypothetical protein
VKRSKKVLDGVVDEKSKTSEEDKAFKQCEQAYLPMIQKWRSSIEVKAIVSLQIQFQEIAEVVDVFIQVRKQAL